MSYNHRAEIDPTHSESLRLLVVDKVAVLKSNRLRWRQLVELANIELTLLVPTHWVENCVDEPYQPDEGEPFKTVRGVPSWAGRELHSIYLSGVVRAMLGSRPEVILLMEESFSLFALQVVMLQKVLAPNAKVIFYSNNITSYIDFPYRFPSAYRILSAIVMGMSDVGLCVNQRAAEVLAASSFRGEIKVLFYGINNEIFRPLARQEARLALGLPEDLELFLYAGRLLELKGVQDLVEAFAGLRHGSPGRSLRLLILGDGDYRDALLQRVEELQLHDTVEFRRAVPLEQVSTYMCAANAFVLPSRAEWNEQFGRVNAEAMLVGTAIIGSTSGEIPRVIGDGGYIFTAGDSADLQRAMRAVLDDPDGTRSRTERGRAAAIRDYSMRGFVDGLIDLFERLAERTLVRETG